jgi:23S rRNA (guanine2445-N2)-methyltransferase / 23S rRNA (guanine2069-N7)-methyltransferase
MEALFVSCPSGVEPLLARELASLGAGALREVPAGVQARGDLQTAYRICLWSRLASRVLLELARFPSPDADALYAGVQTVDWSRQLSPSGTLAVGFTGTNRKIKNTHFGAQRVKDAVVDQLRVHSGRRPSIDRERPDLRPHVHLHRHMATLSIDLVGQPLHRRGYRGPGAQAPLKENLAAAILLLSDWPATAAQGRPFLDPMCGSGTLVIEAALMAGDIAPGLLRSYFGFQGWKGHDATVWDDLVADAEARRSRGLRHLPTVQGSDHDPVAVAMAREAVRRAGLSNHVGIEQGALTDLSPPVDRLPGLLVTNPPYGRRLAGGGLGRVYADLGRALRRGFSGWRATVFTGNPDLLHRIRLAHHQITLLYNGAIPCRLVAVDVPERQGDAPADAPGSESRRNDGEGAEAFANRLRKNLRTIGLWAERQGIACYRLYDADIPEFAVAVDVYGNQQRWLHVQEYAAPHSIDAQAAAQRLRALMARLPGALDIPEANIFLKRRKRQKGRAQYEKIADTGHFHEVREDDKRFLVNFEDYLDTGLFLDHRPMRRLIAEMSAGRHFLNLFAYTGTATVYAALGGARSTTTVDMSKTYLSWAQRNLELNLASCDAHVFIQADCLQWVRMQGERMGGPRYDLIFLDPPTFSASKRMSASFDVQRDHVPLLRDTSRLLAPGGTLIFSTNRRGFRLDAAELPELVIEDITEATIGRDFARNPRIHTCFRIQRA